MANRGNFSAQARANPGLISSRNAAVKEARGLAIKVDGLAATQAVLRATDKEAQKALREGLKDAGLIVAAEARTRTPNKSGALARSIRVSAAGNAVRVGSRLPYANVIHWGGSTGKGHRPGQPWSGSVLVRPSLFISRALDATESRVTVRVEQAIDSAFVRAGWR